MKKLLLVLFLTTPAYAQYGPLRYSPDSQATGRTLSPANVNTSTINITQNGATVNAYPSAPLVFACKTNGPCQLVGQNLSNGINADGNIVLTNDLGGNASFYLNLGINSSKYSQVPFAAEPSSAGFLYTSDSPLFIGAGFNGNVNGATYNGQNSPYIVFLTSTATGANINMWISTSNITIPATSSMTVMGGAFSVAGSTFSVSNGSVAIGGSAINVLATPVGQRVVFTPNISSFTTTGAISGTFANTVLGPCVSTVSLTLPLGQSVIHVDVHGTISVNSLAAVIGIGLLVDSTFTDGETNAKGLTAPQEAVSTDGTNMSFSENVSGLASGSHTICLAPFVSGGTGTIDSTNSVMKMQAYILP